MEFTPNYNLKKPGQNDYVVIGDLNENADTIDTAMKQLQDNITAGNNIRASGSQLGNVIVGSNISVNNGTISIPNASTTTMGVMRVGNGLNAINGVVSANYHVDNTKTTNNTPADFLTGTTITLPDVGSTNETYLHFKNLLENLLGTVFSGLPFRFEMITTKRSAYYIYQTINVYSNFASSSGSLIYTLTRSVDYSTGQFVNFGLSIITLFGRGNPNGVMYGLKGWIYNDIENNILYQQTTSPNMTSNTGWLAIGQETVNGLETLQNNFNTHIRNYTEHVPYTNDTGTDNAKLVSLNPAPTSYIEGMAVSFKNRLQNTGAVTININGLGARSILKSNGNPLTSGSLRADSVYTIRYNGTSFFLQGEGGEYGTATASQVLSGYTVGTENGVVNGTIANRGAVTSSLNAGAQYNIPAGYHNGSGIITANSLSSQTPANATASQILGGRTAWVNGTRITGAMVDRTFSGNGGDYTNASSFLSDGSGSLTVAPLPGYYDSTVNSSGFGSIIIPSPEFLPQNIVAGKRIFDKVGTATIQSLGGKVFARGTTYTNGQNVPVLQVTGLGFRPSCVIVRASNTGSSSGISVSINGTEFVPPVNSMYEVHLDESGNAVTAGGSFSADGFTINVSGDGADYFSWIAYE